MKSRPLNVNVGCTSASPRGYDFVAMLLKNNFKESGFKILGNWKLYDLLKGQSLRSPTFAGGLMGFGMLAETSSDAVDSSHLG